MRWCVASSRPSPADAASSAAAALVAVLLTCPSAAAAAPRVVLLPAENLSEVTWADKAVAPLVQREVERRGWTVLAGPDVETLLATTRTRRLDALPTPTREALFDRLEADAYLATTVFSFRDSDVPLVAVGVRLVGADGGTLFADVVGLSSENTQGPLDQRPGTDVEPIVEEVLRRVFERFPAADRPFETRDESRGSPSRLPAPRSYVAAALRELPAPRRIVVLPFDNLTRRREASRIASQLAGMWLDRSRGFVQVDPADVRAAFVAEGVRDPMSLEPEVLTAIGRRLGSPLFLRGTVLRWRPGNPQGTHGGPPDVELNLTLIDTETSRVLWSSHHGRSGDEYRGFLRLGAITNVVGLADRVVAEMLDEQQTAKPVEARRGASDTRQP